MDNSVTMATKQAVLTAQFLKATSAMEILEVLPFASKFHYAEMGLLILENNVTTKTGSVAVQIVGSTLGSSAVLLLAQYRFARSVETVSSKGINNVIIEI